MQLRKSETLGVFDDQSVCVWHIDSRLYYRGADKDIYFARHHLFPNVLKLFLVHLSVCHGYLGIGYRLCK